MERITILLADDTVEMQSFVQRILNPAYTLVESVTDGQAVLERVPVLKPAVVLLDISMPGMDGFTCARRLKQIAGKTKIIFLTVEDDQEILHEAQAIGYQGYVLKACLATDLNMAIHEALENRCFTSSSEGLNDNS